VQAIQPKTQATVAYVQTNGGLVAREVRLLGVAQHLPGEENGQLKKEPSGRFGYFSKSLEPPPSKQPATVPERQPSTITQLVKLTEGRLQATDRQGAPAIERVRGEVQFYIAFYVQVDAKTPMRLAYQCLRPDLEIRDLKLMRWCTAEEVVPAGFHGVRYRAFPMKYSPAPGSTAGKDLIVAEMAPVITNGNSEVRAFQRKLLPVEVVP
jgi:hypothetical protein